MIKFGAFLTLIADDYDYIATGHYAHTIDRNGWRYLVHTTDMIKDQTYFLSYTPYQNISRVIFPLGTFTNKDAVREYAIQHNLPSATRKDSQGICFLGKIPFEKFVEHHCGIKKGKLIELETGNLLGEHNGFWFFTIGQRQGIRLHGGPWYVIKKDIGSNTVFISKQNPKILDAALTKQLTIYHMNFLVPENEKMALGKTYKIKIRHGQYFNEATILSYLTSDTMTIEILHADQGIASGQIIAFYSDENICLASGIIGQ
jgi:tRNA-specific 2-thiouridylase